MWARLLAGIEAGDQGGHVAAAWVAAQELRAISAPRGDRRLKPSGESELVNSVGS